MKIRHLLFFMLLVAFATSGCIFNPEDDPVEPPPTPPVECTVAESADAAMATFVEVYSGRVLECYRDLLSEDYIFVDKDGDYTNFDTEIAIADKMFNGIEGANNYIISDISISQFDPTGTWTPTPANDPDFGGFTDSQYRTYTVHMEFNISGHNLTLIVRGPVIYYVINEGNADAPDFRIVGMRDLTLGGDDD